MVCLAWLLDTFPHSEPDQMESLVGASALTTKAPSDAAFAYAAIEAR